MSQFFYNDGGRKDAGFKGDTGDCVTRAIAIVTGKPYQEVYDRIFELAKESPRNGVHKKVYKPYIEKELSLVWTPTMGIGTGCTVHLVGDELPKGKLIVRTSKHLTAMIDGVIHDTYDPSRGGTRCVYGYWKMPSYNIENDPAWKALFN
tara:strand:+ start:1050 stop:1496 length:447 start_codon:yes stop_codon:yes gene_type:complete